MMVTQHGGTVAGVFDDATQAASAIEELMQRGFGRKSVGFVVRHDKLQQAFESPEADESGEPGPKRLARGLLGGVLGVLDVLLVPFIGPADASNVLATALPVAEEAFDRLPSPSAHSTEEKRVRPDAATTTAVEAEVPHEQHQRTVLEDERTGAVTGGIIGGVLGAAIALLIPGVGPAIAGGILATTIGGAAIGGISGGFLGTFEQLGIPSDQVQRYQQHLASGKVVVTVLAGDRPQEVSTLLRLHHAHDVQVH